MSVRFLQPWIQGFMTIRDLALHQVDVIKVVMSLVPIHLALPLSGVIIVFHMLEVAQPIIS
jgi:hypothetical protein